jgi:hypothetical protein
VKQTTPWTRTARSVSGNAGVPISSSAVSTESGTIRRTCRATSPSSTSTESTPTARNASAFPALQVVDSTVMPIRLASTAVAMPIEEVPPRIRIDCPGRASRPTVSEP